MIQNPFFPEIHGNFGFGCMRLPMRDGHVNYEEFCRMADAFIASGLNYFDTAHGYIGGQAFASPSIALRSPTPGRRSSGMITFGMLMPWPGNTRRST